MALLYGRAALNSPNRWPPARAVHKARAAAAIGDVLGPEAAAAVMEAGVPTVSAPLARR